VLSEQEADLVTHCLRGVVSDGTGTAADFGRPAAGKTGTTQDNKDAWFVGYTPKLTAAVWMGYADPLPDGSGVPTMNGSSSVSRNHGLNGVTGGSLPAEIWRKFMEAATEGMDTGTFTEATSFPGRILNDELEPTTTTASTTTTSSTTTSSTTSTTAPTTTSSSTPTTEPTTTTEPGEP
jgi:penicillin-binding protein 1A